MAHQLWLVKGSTMTNITPLIGTISWRGNKDELGEEISFDIAFNDTRFFPKNPCDLGDMVILENNDYEITRTIIVDENRAGSGPISYTSFDYAFYLNKSTSIYQFKKMVADQCITKILKDFGIPIGNIISIPFPVDKIFNGVAPNVIIKEIIEMAENKLKTKYLIEMRAGKMYIEKQEDIIVKANFKLYKEGSTYDATTAIMNPTRKRSIVDMKNSIQVVGNDDKLVLSQSDDEMVEKYGKLQKVVQLDQEEKKTAKEIAEKELKEFSKIVEEVGIELLGDDKVRAGRLIEIEEPVTGIKGKYLIKDVNHTISGGIHKMIPGLEVFKDD